MKHEEKKKKNKVGRPSKYNPRVHPEQARVACAKMDATDEALAELFGVPYKTMETWCERHQEFRDAIKNGRDAWRTLRAEDSLVKRAFGFSYDETTKEKVIGKDGETKQLVKVVTKYVPPDVGAICFWLKNRNRARWKDYKAVEVGKLDGSDPIDINVTITDD